MTIDVIKKYIVAAGTEVDFTNEDGFHLLTGANAKLINDGTVSIVTNIGVSGVVAEQSGTSTVVNAAGAMFNLHMTGEIGETIGFDLHSAANVLSNAGGVDIHADISDATGASGSNLAFANSGQFYVTAQFDGLGVRILDGGTFDNSGQLIVTGLHAATAVALAGEGVSFHNTGIIHAFDGQLAVGVDWSGSTSLFENDGEIEAIRARGGQGIALRLGDASDPAATVLIDNQGTLKGQYAIWDQSDAGSADSIQNSGKLIGVVDLGLGNDQLVNTGSIKGAVHLGDGGDLYDTSAGDQKGLVDGGAGNDILIGGAGREIFTGGDGADRLVGGLNVDEMTGGAGNDTFVFQSLADSTADNADQITDLENGDRIYLAAIDADTTLKGNQAFHLVATLDGHAGELALSYEAGFNRTTVALDVDGDGVADSTIFLAGDHTDFTNFVL